MKPKLSIVLASHNAQSTAEGCLKAIESQLKDESVEIIVVDSSSDGTRRLLETLRPQLGLDFHLLPLESSLLIPELWQAGIEESRGDIVALSTTHCIPAADWIEQILKAHQNPRAAGIGGAIVNAPDADWVQWAIYFCRYSLYMPPFPPVPVDDMAADNASYKREALELCRAERRNGFWEPAVHRRLLKEGWQLLKTPTIVVTHKKSFSLLGFMVQRFQHGKQFGEERAARFSPQRRLLYLLLSPCIPVLFVARIARRVLSRKQYRRIFLLSSPILMLFVLSWSIGEACGYGRAARVTPND